MKRWRQLGLKAAAARKKEEAKLAKGTDEGTSSAPKTITKVLKTKPDGKDDRPSKKVAITLGDVFLKTKSPLKPSYGAGKGVMTSSNPVIESHYCLLTHKDYAVGEVGSFIKPTDIEPCNLLGTEDLGASALFYLTRICSLSQAKLVSFLSNSFD